MDALWISLRTVAAASAITFALGVLAAYAVHACRRRAVAAVLDGLLTLPLVLPPTVAGFFLLYAFGVQGPIGRALLDWFGVKIVFSWGATVIAAVAISFPLMYRSARGAFAQVDPSYVQAARTLGLSEWRIFARVLFPLSMPGVASGAVLAFARALGEFGATAMIAGNIAGRTRTLPLQVYSAVAAGDMDAAMRSVALLVGISFLALVGLEAIARWRGPYRRGMGVRDVDARASGAGGRDA